MDWPFADLSLVVDKGKIVWEDPGLATRLDQEWREAERRTNWGHADELGDSPGNADQPDSTEEVPVTDPIPAVGLADGTAGPAGK
jgi:hypothetical protein